MVPAHDCGLFKVLRESPWNLKVPCCDVPSSQAYVSSAAIISQACFTYLQSAFEHMGTVADFDSTPIAAAALPGLRAFDCISGCLACVASSSDAAACTALGKDSFNTLMCTTGEGRA